MLSKNSLSTNFVFHASKLVRAHRKKLNLTQAALAKKCNVAQTTICRAEIDFSKIKFGLAIRILKGVGIQDNFENSNCKEFPYENLNISNKRYLNESKSEAFFNILKTNDQIWAYFNYDPASCARVLIELLKIQIND